MGQLLCLRYPNFIQVPGNEMEASHRLHATELWESWTSELDPKDYIS